MVGERNYSEERKGRSLEAGRERRNWNGSKRIWREREEPVGYGDWGEGERNQ